MNNRNVAIDAFRGLMLLSMTFNHLALLPFVSVDFLRVFVPKYLFHSFGFLSNSEGFFFLSGLVTGIVYGKLVLKGKNLELWPRAKKRIIQMYGIHLGLLFCFAIFLTISNGYMEGWKHYHSLTWDVRGDPGIHYFMEHPWIGFLLGSVFLYTPFYFDILPVYMLLLAITPFVIRQLSQGRVKLIIGISMVSWLTMQYVQPGFLEAPLRNYIPVKLGWFNPFGIQLLFISGLTFGYFYIKGSLINAYRLFSYAGLALAVLFMILWITGGDVVSAHHLGFLRIVSFSVKATIAFICARFFTVKSLALLGKHSLVIFAYHIVLAFGLVFFFSEITALPSALKVTSLVLSLLSLWIPAWYLENRQTVRRLSSEKQSTSTL